MGKRVRAGTVRVVKDGRVVRIVSGEFASRLLEKDNAEAVSYRGEFALQLVAGATEKAAVRTVQLGSLKAAQCSSERDARSSCVMSRLEIEAIVGLHGESKTKGMGDWMRDQRVRVGQEAEDLVERAQNKFPSFVPQGRKVAA
jgi:hypothetical protein